MCLIIHTQLHINQTYIYKDFDINAANLSNLFLDDDSSWDWNLIQKLFSLDPVHAYKSSRHS